MKGKLIYDQDGWWVQHRAKGLDGNLEYVAESMLHPDDVKKIEEDAKVFDNIEARIAAYPDVEFEMVTEVVASVGNSEEQDEYTVSYAKLIPSKEQQKQLITEIMELDAKDGLYDTVNELDKRIELTYEERVRWFVNNYYETGMEYASMLESMKNKDLDNFVWYGEKIQIPKFYSGNETLYTEEDIKKAFEAGHAVGVYLADYKHDKMYQEFLKSLKQPKKD
jgi:hypothetical protein